MRRFDQITAGVHKVSSLCSIHTAVGVVVMNFNVRINTISQVFTECIIRRRPVQGVPHLTPVDSWDRPQTPVTWMISNSNFKKLQAYFTPRSVTQFTTSTNTEEKPF